MGIRKSQRKERTFLTSSLNSAGNLLRGLGYITSLSWSSKIEENMGNANFLGFPADDFQVFSVIIISITQGMERGDV